MPPRYLKIHFTASQWVFLGFDINLLTTSIAWPMFGLVHIITYIKLPMTEEYTILAINYFSSTFLRDQSIDKRKWLPKGVLTGLSLSMLNLCKTRLMYSIWDNCKVPFCLSLMICIRRIFFVGPKSFMSNCFYNYFFKFLILIIFEPVTNISST